jgi:hypothetical protein
MLTTITISCTTTQTYIVPKYVPKTYFYDRTNHTTIYYYSYPKYRYKPTKHIIKQKEIIYYRKKHHTSRNSRKH